jgi:hypothetical protein
MRVRGKRFMIIACAICVGCDADAYVGEDFPAQHRVMAGKNFAIIRTKII